MWVRAASPANPEPAQDSLASPFDLWAVEHEQAPRGALDLSVERDGARLRLRVPPGEWRLKVRPPLATW